MDQAQDDATTLVERSANGHGETAATPATPGAKPAFMGVQHRWLRGMRGKAVSIRLQSGEVITGLLEADDTYTLALRIRGYDETALVYKHSIEFLVPAATR